MSDQRIDIDAENLGQGLGRLVVVILDVVRQVLERQALRRVDGGSLSPEEIERLGQALLGLEVRFAELRAIFGVSEDPQSLPVEEMKGVADAGNHRKPNAETE